MRQLSLVGFRWRRKHRCNSGAYRRTHRHTVTWSACNPRSASNSSTSRYDRQKRKYHPTASRMTSGSNCRHLNKPQTEDARRSIQPAYHRVTVKLQHFPFTEAAAIGATNWGSGFLGHNDSMSGQKILQPFDSLSFGRQRITDPPLIDTGTRHSKLRGDLVLGVASFQG